MPIAGLARSSRPAGKRPTLIEAFSIGHSLKNAIDEGASEVQQVIIARELLKD